MEENLLFIKYPIKNDNKKRRSDDHENIKIIKIKNKNCQYDVKKIDISSIFMKTHMISF